MAISYNVFISHNISEENKKLIKSLDAIIPSNIHLYIAEYNSEPGTILSERIENAIVNCDAMIVILTKDIISEWVQQEIGIAKTHKKLIIPIVEKGGSAKGVIAGVEWIEMNYSNPKPALKQVKKALDKNVKLRIKEQKEKEGFWVAITLVIILIITILITYLFMKSKRK